MAPEIPNQKRKRGAAAGLPVSAQDASQRAPRGRRNDKEADAPADEPPAAADDAATGNTHTEKPGKRGRPKKGESKPTEEQTESTTGGARRSTRDRRSTDDAPWWIAGANNAEEEEEAAGDSTEPPKKRPRLSQGAVAPGVKKQGAPEPSRRAERTTAGQQDITKSPRRSKPQPVPTREQNADVDAAPKRRGRPRKSDLPIVGEEEPGQEVEAEPRRRGRPRKSDVSTIQQEEPSMEDEAQPKRRGRPRLSNVSAASPTVRKAPDLQSAEARKSVAEERTAHKASQRRVSQNAVSQAANQSVAELDDELAASLPPVPPYRQLEPRVRQIPMSTINSKWSPLNEAATDAISTIISDASRPVLQRLRDNQTRHQQAQEILRTFTSKIQRMLRKGQPFPPPSTRPPGSKAVAGDGHVEELTFESVVDLIDSMETMLNPLLHSVALLEKEKSKEEAALEQDYETLRTLEANAKAEAGGWRERMKKAHALAPDPRKRDDEPELDRVSGEKLSLVKEESTPLVGVFSDTTDEGLLSMSKQIASHMVSIQKNVQPVQDVLPAIAKSRAALQGVLQGHLAQQQFERVLLG